MYCFWPDHALYPACHEIVVVGKLILQADSPQDIREYVARLLRHEQICCHILHGLHSRSCLRSIYERKHLEPTPPQHMIRLGVLRTYDNYRVLRVTNRHLPSSMGRSTRSLVVMYARRLRLLPARQRRRSSSVRYPHANLGYSEILLESCVCRTAYRHSVKNTEDETHRILATLLCRYVSRNRRVPYIHRIWMSYRRCHGVYHIFPVARRRYTSIMLGS